MQLEAVAEVLDPSLAQGTSLWHFRPLDHCSNCYPIRERTLYRCYLSLGFEKHLSLSYENDGMAALRQVMQQVLLGRTGASLQVCFQARRESGSSSMVLRLNGSWANA